MSSNSNASRQPVDYTGEEITYGKVGIYEQGSAEGGAVQVEQPPIPMASVESEAQRRDQTWRRREQYRIASLTLVIVALVTALGSIAIAAVVFNDCSNFHRPGSDSDALDILGTFLLYIFVVVESGLCIIATVVLLVHLCRRPDAVLLRAPFEHGSFVCLCISIFTLALLAGYSLAACVIAETQQLDPKEPVALCVVPACRIVALLSFFGVLIANRKLR